MDLRKFATRGSLSVLGLFVLLCFFGWNHSRAWAQTPGQQGTEQSLAPAIPQKDRDVPPYRVAERARPSQDDLRTMLALQPNEHPLMPTLRWARYSLHVMESIQDYSATLVKRQRIDGKVTEPEYSFVKIRQNPFSVYMRFLGPPSLKGREAIYVKGLNQGKILGHGTGVQSMFGTLALDPTGPLAMRGNRYPITELGVENLVRRLIEVGEKDSQYGECEVKFTPNAKINNRLHTCIQVVHPVPRRNFIFHLARIFVDEELNIPTRFEAWDWPSQPGIDRSCWRSTRT